MKIVDYIEVVVKDITIMSLLKMRCMEWNGSIYDLIQKLFQENISPDLYLEDILQQISRMSSPIYFLKAASLLSGMLH